MAPRKRPATQQDQSGSFEAVWDGKTYRVDVTDIARSEWRVLRREYDVTQQEILQGLSELDLDMLAGVMWLVMRRDDPSLKLDDLDLKLSDLADFGAKGEPADPPA